MTDEEMNRIGVAGRVLTALNAYEAEVGPVMLNSTHIALDGLPGGLWRNLEGLWWWDPDDPGDEGEDE